MTSFTPPVRDLSDPDRDLGLEQGGHGDSYADDRPAGVPAAAEEVLPPEVTLPGHRIHVVLEDGGEQLEWEVRVDNRDFLRWDKAAPRQKWDAQKQPFLLQTFLAWSASRRAGKTDLTFDAFGDTCLEAKDLKDVTAAGEDGDEARPTR